MEKKKSALPIVLLIALVVLAAGGFYVTQMKPASQTAAVDGETAADITMATDTSASATEDTQAAATTGTETAAAVDEEQSATAGEETAAASTLNIEEAMSDRAIGNPDAKVVIEEFSSLNCPHCAHFHTDAFEKIKAEYIDTGKIYYIQRDFPLNGPALHGAMVARCLPKERYFSFMDLLFKNQESWAFKPDYINYLRQNSALAGLSNRDFDSCIANKELQTTMQNKMREGAVRYSINSTPSFLLNGALLKFGAADFAVFKQVIDDALEKGESQN